MNDRSVEGNVAGAVIPTPRTDELGRALGLAWFGLRDPLGRAQDESARYRELARTLERELADETKARQAWAPAIAVALDEFAAPHDTGDLSECVRGIRALGSALAEANRRLSDAQSVQAGFRCCGAADMPCPSFEVSCVNPANYPPCTHCNGKGWRCCENPILEDRSMPGHPMPPESICCQEFVTCGRCQPLRGPCAQEALK